MKDPSLFFLTAIRGKVYMETNPTEMKREAIHLYIFVKLIVEIFL